MQSFWDEFARRDFAHTCQYDPESTWERSAGSCQSWGV
jgi:hypothetical protein